MMWDMDKVIDPDIIQKSLPHRAPFLLVDEVVGFDQEWLLGNRLVRADEFYFPGHFPGNPVMPGVLIIEACAQLCGIAASLSAGVGGDKALMYLAGVEKARFKKPVLPGDQLDMRVKTLAVKGPLWRFQVEASVREKLVCTAVLLSYAKYYDEVGHD